MTRSLKYVGLLLLLIFIGYHSVYFKSLKDVKEKGDGFAAAAYAERFFREQLVPLSDSAIRLADLMVLLKNNKEAAFNQYGYALSIGSIRYFLVKGNGTVIDVNPNIVGVRLADTAGTTLNLVTEFVFGNAIRDASGKITLSEFSNLSDVNNISMELNKIVRTKVLPPFKKAVAAGDTILFYGALELNKERLNLDEVEIIPIQLQIVNQESKDSKI
jgi:predicted lipoprotein